MSIWTIGFPFSLYSYGNHRIFGTLYALQIDTLRRSSGRDPAPSGGGGQVGLTMYATAENKMLLHKIGRDYAALEQQVKQRAARPFLVA